MGWQRDRRASAARATGAAVALALLALAACASGAADQPPSTTSVLSAPARVVASAGPVDDRFGDGMVDEQSVQLVVDSLAVAGVGVVAEDASPSAPAPDGEVDGPITVGELQARAQGAQADLGGGLSGRELRDAFALPPAVVPIDALLAAWLVDGLTPAAQAAAALVDPAELEDPAASVFPWAVTLMFANDIARASTTWSPAAAAAIPPDASRCDERSARLAASLGSLTVAVGNGPPALDRLVEVAVPAFGLLLPTTVTDAIDAADRPALAAAVTGLGFTAALAGVVEPWTVALVPDPPAIEMGGLDGPGQEGSFEALVVTVDAWPPEVSSCAHESGVTLPPLDPRGAEVSWSFADAGAADVEYAAASLVGGAGVRASTAALRYVTRSVEPGGSDDAPAPRISATLRVHHEPAEPLLVITERLTAAALLGAPSAVLDALAGDSGDALAGLVAMTSARASSDGVPVTESRSDG